jgi:hypothetical protein
MKKQVLVVMLCLAGVGCSGAIRTAEPYRDDVQAVLETKNGDVKACYDTLLQSNKDAAGRVTVHFTVEAKTGAFKDIKTVADGTTAPPELQQCVTTALSGLVLSPGDANTGDATFVYEFNVGEPAAS